jgi:sterol desaturase/sphingolipid hydroxylase (fatty acid hydroxylase superfamily)
MTEFMSPAGVAFAQLARFFNPSEGFFLPYLAGGVLFAAAVMLWRRRARANIRPGALLRLLGSKKQWLHRSTRLDMKLYLMNGILVVVGYSFFQATSGAWRDGTLSALGHSPHLPVPFWFAVGFATIFQVLWLDLTYWAMHYAHHKVPMLWEVHKIHHSAEVMTPLSEWRMHPIEFVLFANVLTFSSGTAFAGMEWLFGPGAHPLTLFQINILLLLHLASFHHLRHSGVWIAATGWLGRLVHSPAHHQIHHSVREDHFDRNLGYALSLWDWLFGTLVIPEARGRVTIGVPGEPAHRGVVDSLVRPLVAGATRMHRARATF